MRERQSIALVTRHGISSPDARTTTPRRSCRDLGRADATAVDLFARLIKVEPPACAGARALCVGRRLTERRSYGSILVRQCPTRSGAFLNEAIRAAIRAVAEHRLADRPECRNKADSCACHRQANDFAPAKFVRDRLKLPEVWAAQRRQIGAWQNAQIDFEAMMNQRRLRSWAKAISSGLVENRGGAEILPNRLHKRGKLTLL